jgi:hypothetical protein
MCSEQGVVDAEDHALWAGIVHGELDRARSVGLLEVRRHYVFAGGEVDSFQRLPGDFASVAHDFRLKCLNCALKSRVISAI